MLRRALALLAVPAVLPALLLAGCATPAPSGGAPGDDVVPDGPGQPVVIAADGPVVGQGIVLQQDGEEAVFCLGPILESYPPQCEGPVLRGWEWPDDEMHETSNGVTWGSYAVVGSWDGVEFTATGAAIPLALYDPVRPEPDPHADPANAGANPEALLARVQEELAVWTDVTVLETHTENGYVWATVYYDDGTLQSYLDEVYGPDVVVLQSAFRDVPAA